MAKIDNRDIYERLWTGRDFEINHLWQRSVFLATFLVLIFTAYCGLWVAFIGMEKDDVTAEIEYEETLLFFQSIDTVTVKSDDSGDIFRSLKQDHVNVDTCMEILSFTGCMFSLLWIFMSKGSKFWYENYENSINAMHKDESLFSDDVNCKWRLEELSAKVEWRCTRHVPIQGHLRHFSENQSICSREGAAYSMSKVNVVLGQVFFLFWFIALGFHFCIKDSSYEWKTYCICFRVILYIVFWIILTYAMKRYVAGGQFNHHTPPKEWFYPIAAFHRWKKKNSEYLRDIALYRNIAKDNSRKHDNPYFKKEKEYLDNIIGNSKSLKLTTYRHLKYEDYHKLKLFLEEFSCSGEFPGLSGHEWRDSVTGCKVCFPLTEDNFLKIVRGYVDTSEIHCIRCFADIVRTESLEDVGNEKGRLMNCIALNNHGIVCCAVEFVYHCIDCFDPYIAYRIIDDRGAVVREGLDIICDLKKNNIE